MVIVSLGTGFPPYKSYKGAQGIMDLLIQAATDSEKIHEEMEKRTQDREDCYYKRRNPYISDIALDETNAVPLMERTVENFLGRNANLNDMNEIGEKLTNIKLK